MTPARPELDEDVPPSDTQIARVYAELEGMHQDVGDVDISQVLRTILRQTQKKEIIQQNGPVHLAYHKCLLLSEAMPAAFVEIDCADDGACRLLACVVALAQHLRLEDMAQVCEPTWTHRLVAPYMSLVADGALSIKYDGRTVYSEKRPDVQLTFGTRVAACVEVKGMWARATEKLKDQSRVVQAVMKYMAPDAATMTLVNTLVRLAMWSSGKDMCVYEVIRYSCGLAIAVEVARFDLPVAIRRGTVSQVAPAIGCFSAVAARIDRNWVQIIAKEIVTTGHMLEKF
ncbi:hypothetical protein HDU86_002747 [Geranomyces michiganensis]|nr:hypothetical protein HDU86_002747 [Geranomyces michiganensis]